MASSLCKCLLRVCFADETSPDDDDSSRDEEAENYEPLRSNRMSRLFPSTDPLYSVAAQVEESMDDENDDQNDDDDDHDDSEENNCCQSNNSNDNDNTTSTSNTTATVTTAASTMWSDNNPHAIGLKQFWRRFTERFNLEDPGASAGGATTTSSSSSRRHSTTRRSSAAERRRQQQERDEREPILKQASSFDSSKEIPTIQTEQIVLPGSELQQQMAKAMASKLEEHDDECVICMDGFTPTNPRMPTLCGCGENKTYFHLPCLYQWIEQDRNCPSCRKKLRWEEF